MKRLFILTILSVFVIGTFAQTQRYFCEIKGIEKDLSSGLKIVFDFGNNPIYSAWGGLKSKQKLVDENGEEIPFNSMVDAGNYMSSKGGLFSRLIRPSIQGKSLSIGYSIRMQKSPKMP